MHDAAKKVINISKLNSGNLKACKNKQQYSPQSGKQVNRKLDELSAASHLNQNDIFKRARYFRLVDPATPNLICFDLIECRRDKKDNLEHSLQYNDRLKLEGK